MSLTFEGARLKANSEVNLREFACLTTVILASGAETLGSEQPAVHHFRFIRFIRFIRFRSPGGSESV